MQLPLAVPTVGTNLWALAHLRRSETSERSALAVCVSLAVGLVFVCGVLDSPTTASHASMMLLPAVAVHLVGVRRALYLTLPVSVVLGLFHPLRFLVFEDLPWRDVAQLWVLDGSAALFMLGMWAVSGMHASARLQTRGELEQALRTLRESEHKLSTLIENTDDPLCSFDLEGRYIVVNSALMRPCCSQIAAVAPLSLSAQSRTAARPAPGPGRAARTRGGPSW